MAACLSTIRIRQKDGFADVPCGRCGFCLSNRRKEWSFRLQKEMRCHESASFITLTYSDSNIRYMDDINHDTGECIPYPVLVKKDLQDFIKRVRYYQSKLTNDKIKYYAVGEYGTKTKRPHYHALMFGIHRGVKIDNIWEYGHTDVGTCTLDSIDYVTKYVVNKKDYKHFLVPPFSCISNGIGLQHLEDNYELYKSKDVVRGDRGYNQRCLDITEIKLASRSSVPV
ncbi:putative replication initiation protein [Eel River basin pequenovirus]|nr:putative replication initiation protein [Eel River basin pequenovirus]